MDGFVNNSRLPPAVRIGSARNGAACLEAFTEATNNNVTNLIDVDPAPQARSGWNVTKPNSAWEHFPNATFATFNSMLGMNTRYEREYDDDILPSAANFGGRFRSYLDNGLNYSFNYFYGYDSNPSLNMHWENRQWREAGGRQGGYRSGRYGRQQSRSSRCYRSATLPGPSTTVPTSIYGAISQGLHDT